MQEKYLLPTLYFWIYYFLYFNLPLIKLEIEMKVCNMCIECFYKELFDVPLKRFYPKEGVTDFTPFLREKI